MLCPLCGLRRGRRACPALGKKICAVCCGTKRLVQIQCPSDCGYLASAREHPPVATLRQQQRDLALFVQFMRDLSQRQSELFFVIDKFLLRYEPPQLHPLVDDDVIEAAAASAATLETAARGVIYEHRAASLPAQRLVIALREDLTQAGENGGTAFERDAATVLRRVEQAAGEARAADPGNRRAFLDLLGRLLPQRDEIEPSAADQSHRLIVP